MHTFLRVFRPEVPALIFSTDKKHLRRGTHFCDDLSDLHQFENIPARSKFFQVQSEHILYYLYLNREGEGNAASQPASQPDIRIDACIRI